MKAGKGFKLKLRYFNFVIKCFYLKSSVPTETIIFQLVEEPGLRNGSISKHKESSLQDQYFLKSSSR